MPSMLFTKCHLQLGGHAVALLVEAPRCSSRVVGLIPEISPPSKDGQCVGLTNLVASYADFLETLGASGSLQSCTGIALPFTLI
jgi:hypothetical protein